MRTVKHGEANRRICEQAPEQKNCLLSD